MNATTNIVTPASPETDLRRAARLAALEPILSSATMAGAWLDNNAPASKASIAALNYGQLRRLCVYLATMRSLKVGDTGPLLQSHLIDVANVLGWQVASTVGVGKLDKAIATITGTPTVATIKVSKAAQKHAASIAAQTPAPVAPVPTPVAAAVAQTVATPLPVFTPDAEVPIAGPLAAEVVTTPPPSNAPIAPLSPAHVAYPTGNWQPASKVFGIKSLVGNVEVFDGSHVKTPAIDHDYVWDKRIAQRLVASLNEDTPTHVWLYGERGTGKSSAAQQLAARLGRPFYKVTFDKYSERSTIIGGKGLHSGNTTWEDGELTMALRPSVPPIVLLDEICYAQTDAVSGPINEIVHPLCEYHVTETGEHITFDRRTFFIAADNTNGSGDTTGRYHGARAMNRATVDRFGRFIEVQHMTKAEEVKALMARAVCDKPTATKVSELMGKLRAKCGTGALADPPSLREAIAFARDLRAGLLSPADSFQDTFVGKYPFEAHEELRLTFQSVWIATPEVTPVDAPTDVAV